VVKGLSWAERPVAKPPVNPTTKIHIAPR
jgi:hypothetical protein